MTNTSIIISCQKIDEYLLKKEYRKAFGILILELECLEDNEQKDLINYYNQNLRKLGIINDVILNK